MFTEGIKKKFPDYKLDQNYLIQNESDLEIDWKELVSLFKSNDLETYYKDKYKFFGP